MTQLPGIAGEIETVIGLAATVDLIEARGGTTIEIPKRAKGSELARIIGIDAAQEIIDFYGTGRLSIPMAGLKGRRARERKTRDRAFAMIDAGASNMQIALECGLSRRAVQNYRQQYGEDPNGDQLPLFTD